MRKTASRISSFIQQKTRPGSGNNPRMSTPNKVKISTPEQMYELIKLRAYEIYCRRGNFPGDAAGDWMIAERQVKKELNLE